MYIRFCVHDISLLSVCGFTYVKFYIIILFFYYQKVGLSAGGGGVIRYAV